MHPPTRLLSRATAALLPNWGNCSPFNLSLKQLTVVVSKATRRSKAHVSLVFGAQHLRSTKTPPQHQQHIYDESQGLYQGMHALPVAACDQGSIIGMLQS